MATVGRAFVGPTPVPVVLEGVRSLSASHGGSSSTVQVRMSEAQGTSQILPTLVVPFLGSIVARKQMRHRRNIGRAQRCSSISMRYPEQPGELALIAYACQQLQQPKENSNFVGSSEQLFRQSSANFEQTEQFGRELIRQFSHTLGGNIEQAATTSSQLTDDLEPVGTAIRQFSDHLEPVGAAIRQFSDNFDPVGATPGRAASFSRPIANATGFQSSGVPSATSLAPGEFFKIAADVVRDLNTDIIHDKLGPVETMQDIFSDVLLDIYTIV